MSDRYRFENPTGQEVRWPSGRVTTGSWPKEKARPFWRIAVGEIAAGVLYTLMGLGIGYVLWGIA